MARWITILLAILGLGIAGWAVATNRQQMPDLPPVREPSINPFGRGIAALGIAEPATRTVGLLPPEPGLVMGVSVEVGQAVKKGDVLFILDPRPLEAELIKAQASAKVSADELARLRSLPRAEDVEPVRAAAARSRAIEQERAESLERVLNAGTQSAANEWDIRRERLTLDQAKAATAQAESELARVLAGASKEELAVAQSQAEAGAAQVRAITVLLDRQNVRAPRAGTILRRNVEIGEFVGTDASRPALILGDLTSMHVRAQVDEEDIGLLQRAQSEGTTMRVVGRLRGAIVEEFPLTLVRIEPFARPKTNLTSGTTERVDTRVVDVVFAVDKAPPTGLVPGQAVDVFVDVD
ncbi:MAG: biotin/lipoyl-binding protein [Planctomycetes bacterium]|nr:biotin/lipoyl-binding protein [Planctomycetota bacterium]